MHVTDSYYQPQTLSSLAAGGGGQLDITTVINPRPEGYGSRFVILSIYLSTALQRAALTSSLQLRYEQAKRVDGLQSDGWILLKCFRSRVMAGSP